MALVHHSSPECITSGFSIFDVPATSIDTDEVCEVQFFPINSISAGGPIEFQVTTSGSSYYLDLDQTFLKCQIRVKHNGGGNLGADDKVSIVNNSLHSLFQQIDVYLNETLVSASDSAYAYRSYLENLLSFSKEAKASQLCCEGWFTDEAGKFDNVDTTKNDANKGLLARKLWIKQSKLFEMYGKLHLDWFQQGRHLLNSVDVRLRLIRNPDKFVLLCGDNTQAPKVEIVSAILYVKKVKASSNILIAHAKVLQDASAKYIIRKVECKVFSIPTGAMEGSVDSAIVGPLPTIVGVGLVGATAFSGTYATNPFNFKNFDVNHIALCVDGRMVPNHPYTPNFTDDLYVRDYLSLFSATGRLQRDKGLDLTYNDYKNGNCLHFFDLTPDACATGNHMSLNRQGTVRLELKFGTALTQGINIILYCAYQTVSEIDKNRSILTET